MIFLFQNPIILIPVMGDQKRDIEYSPLNPSILGKFEAFSPIWRAKGAKAYPNFSLAEIQF